MKAIGAILVAVIVALCDEVDGLPYLPATGQSADTPLDTAPERL
jgi:hypothetical protein